MTRKIAHKKNMLNRHKKNMINSDVKRYIKVKKKDALDWPGDENTKITQRQLATAMITYIIGTLPDRGLRGCCEEVGIAKSTLSHYFDAYAFSVDETLASLLFARMYYNKKQLYNVDDYICIDINTRRALHILHDRLMQNKPGHSRKNNISDIVGNFMNVICLRYLKKLF